MGDICLSNTRLMFCVHFDSNYYYVVPKLTKVTKKKKPLEKEEKKSYTSKITDRLTQDTNQNLLGVCFALGPLIHHNLFQALILFIRLLSTRRALVFLPDCKQMLNGASESEVKAQVL